MTQEKSCWTKWRRGQTRATAVTLASCASGSARAIPLRWHSSSGSMPLSWLKKSRQRKRRRNGKSQKQKQNRNKKKRRAKSQSQKKRKRLKRKNQRKNGDGSAHNRAKRNEIR